MKKRLIAIILSILMITVLSSCGKNEAGDFQSQADSQAQIESQEQSDNQSQSEELSESELVSADSDSLSEDNDSDFNNDDSESFDIHDGYGSYIINQSEKNGYYTTTFTMVTDGIKFEDGRMLPFTYESLESNGEKGGHIAEINGFHFMLNEYTDYEGTLCQTLECIDEVSGFSRTASVIYYPELEYGDITIGFTYENNENAYTFTFLDGHTEEKTILLDEEKGRYYFKTE